MNRGSAINGATFRRVGNVRAVVAAVVLLAAGGAVAWFYRGSGESTPTPAPPSPSPGGPKAIQVQYMPTSRSLPFLVADDLGLFRKRELIVELVAAEDGNLSSADMLAGRWAGEARGLLARPDNEWLWFEIGAEDRQAEVSLSVLLLPRDGADDGELDRRLVNGDLVLCVADRHWAEEARLLWPPGDGPGPRLVGSLRPDDLARLPTCAVFGDGLALEAAAGDPRFREPLADPRAARAKDRYAWDSAHLVRRSFVDAHPQQTKAIADALAEARTWIDNNPTAARRLLQERCRLSVRPGGKVPQPTLLRGADGAAVVRQWEQAFAPKNSVSVGDKHWSASSVAPPKSKTSIELPSFAPPKPRDVWAPGTSPPDKTKGPTP